MLDHVSIAVSDLVAAEPFYDAVMEALGIAKVGRSDSWIGYGARADADHPDRVYLSIRADAVFAGEPNHAEGRHWCFKAASRAAVDAFWRAGILAGGSDDGAPGLRPAYHRAYYAAYLRDRDGNRIEAVCHRFP